MNDVEAEFHAAMVGIYRRSKAEVGYTPTRFMQMIGERGAIATARHLVAAGPPSEGFATLWAANRLDLTVEHFVIEERFASLFTPAEVATAQQRLEASGGSGP
jgi:hypothetical protein